MTTYHQETTVAKRSFDWPLILFFVLAYAIAWGAFGIVGVVACQSGIADAQTLLAMGEAFQFAGVTLSAPHWLVYLLPRLADFAFSIAGVVTIAIMAGRTGLRELWQRLTRWRIPRYVYVLGLMPVGLYLVATAVAGAFPSANIAPGLVGTEWELVSTLSLLAVSLVAGIAVWRNGRLAATKPTRMM